MRDMYSYLCDITVYLYDRTGYLWDLTVINMCVILVVIAGYLLNRTG